MKMCATTKKILGIEIHNWGKAIVGLLMAIAAGSVAYANIKKTGELNSAAIAAHIAKSEARMNKQDDRIRIIENSTLVMSTNIQWIRQNLEDGRIYKRSNRPRS